MIERNYSLLRLVLVVLWGAGVGAIFATVLLGNDENIIASVVLCTIIGIVVIGQIFAPIRLGGDFMKKRPEEIEKALAAKNLVVKERGGAPLLTQNFHSMAERDLAFHTSLGGDGWRYGDHTHAIYDQFRSGEHKTATIYYSIVEIVLPRALPNMVFDSKRSHKKQFAPVFDRSQEQHLEGDFDKHFTTYFPPHYNIDALAIITPEVMQAMIAADQFDIEISDNKLYLYGPLVPTKKIPDMIKAGFSIRDQLAHNVSTYRDERLPESDGRRRVTALGAQLRENPNKGWQIGVFGIVLFLLGLFTMLTNDRAVPDSDAFSTMIYGILIVLTTASLIYTRRQQNKKRDKEYAVIQDAVARATEPVAPTS